MTNQIKSISGGRSCIMPEMKPSLDQAARKVIQSLIDLYFGDKLERCEHRRDPSDRRNDRHAVVTVTKHRTVLWGGATARQRRTRRNLGPESWSRESEPNRPDDHPSPGQRNLRVDNCHLVELFGDLPVCGPNAARSPHDRYNYKKIGQLLAVPPFSPRSAALGERLANCL